MTDACQFDETDFNYLSRRWEAAGWCYWYEHDAAGHCLIVSSDSTVALPIDGDMEVRFNGEGGVQEEDAFDRWSPERRFVQGSVALSAFDFKSPSPRSVSLPTLNQQGGVPAVESYEYTGAYGLTGRDDSDAKSRIRMEEIEATARLVEAEGNSRYVAPGRWFRLVDHFNHDFYSGSSDPDKDDFLVLSVRHVATSNYLHSEDEKIQYRNWVTCTRKSYPWRPGRGFNSTRTRILAPQTAIVVGAAGDDNIHTDKYGRVRVQFHWDRIGENDVRSSAWIRVSSSWAGAELGAAAIPRVGTEVIVQWLNGCPDRPIITGAVFNERNMPPWSVPTQQALTGLRSRELVPGGGNMPGGRSNHLVLDDTSGEIQAQLKSDHLHSQLALGYIRRIEDNRGRTDARGEGWELRTDGHGVARAAEGMLISTESRPRAQSSITDMDETVQRLKTAYDHHDALAIAALQSQAQESGQQHDIADALKAQHDSIRGTGGKFPELAEPHLVLASPAGIATTSAQSTHIVSGKHTALTTGGSMSIAAGDSLFASIKQTFRLFVHKAGMKLIAANADIDITALQKSVNILAKLDITHTANKITLAAKEEIVINGGGSYTRWTEDGIVTGTKSTWTVHAASHEHTGPDSMPVRSPDLPVPAEVNLPQPGPQSLRFATPGSDELMGDAYAGLPYSIFDADGEVISSGTVPQNGRIPRVQTKERQRLVLQIGDPNAKLEALPPPLPSAAQDEPFHDDDIDDSNESDLPPTATGETEAGWPSVSDSPYYADLQAAWAEQHSHEFLSEAQVIKLIAEASEAS